MALVSEAMVPLNKTLSSKCKRTTCPESHGHGSAGQREGESLDLRTYRDQKKRGEPEVKGQRLPPTNGNTKSNFLLTKE